MSVLVPSQVQFFTAALASFIIGKSLSFSIFGLDALAYALRKHSAFSLSEAASRVGGGQAGTLGRLMVAAGLA